MKLGRDALGTRLRTQRNELNGLNGIRAAQRNTCNYNGSPELWLVVRDEEGDVRDGRFFGASTRRLRLRKDAAVREREDEVEARNA